MSEQFDRKELKIQALLEKVSSLTAQYENQVADLRVELTVSEVEKQQAQQELESLKAQGKVDEDEEVHNVSSLPTSNSAD